MTDRVFKSLPTFDVICERLAEMETCVAAQGNVLNFVVNELQEREMEVAFLMSLINVVIPQSNIADHTGKIPAIRKPAAQVWNEEGRAKFLAMFQAKAKAELDAESLPTTGDAPRESADASEVGKEEAPHAPAEFTITGKVTH